MTLQELLKLEAQSQTSTAAPDSLIGCFRRRSITFFQGQCDASTQVYWLQTRGLCVDLRLAARRPRADGRASLDDFTDFELALLAQGEGGAASTAWDGRLMRWFDWCAFQIHEKWPEPGCLRRVGDCVIEFAPSGAYVEDWRLQPSPPGPVIGLQLIEERAVATGTILHQGGALIVCGHHAALVRGRPCEPEVKTRWVDALQQKGPRPFAKDLFACETCYAVRDGLLHDYVTVLSTNPLREGETLSIRAGFEFDCGTRRVYQTSDDNGEIVQRIFTIDTLEPDHHFHRSTAVSGSAAAWLASEAETLLAHAT